MSDAEWDYFDERCFQRSDTEACREIVDRGLHAAEWARAEGVTSDRTSDFESISKFFHEYVTSNADSSAAAVSESKIARAEDIKQLKVEAMEYIQKTEGVAAVPGTIGLLLFFKAWDIPCIPCTGSGQRTAAHTLASIGINDLFTSIVSDNDYEKGKPDKACFAMGAFDAAAASVNPRMKPDWDTKEVPEQMVVMAFDNRPNGVQSALQVDAIGKRGTAFLVNYELKHPTDRNARIECSDPSIAQEELEAYQSKWGAPGANPSVLVPHPGAIALRDALIELFGFPPEMERSVSDPQTGKMERRVVTGEEYYNTMREHVYNTVKQKWQSVGHPVMPIEDL